MKIGDLVAFEQGDSQSEHTIGLILGANHYANTFSNGTQLKYTVHQVLWNTGEVLSCYEGNLRRIQ